jgi:hypothetical protein
MGKLLRREVILRGVQAVSVFTLLPLTTRAAEQCVDASSESLRESLHYQDPGPDQARHCKDCGFFAMEQAPCGPCQIMTGPVSANAHCDSWSERGKS